MILHKEKVSLHKVHFFFYYYLLLVEPMPPIRSSFKHISSSTIRYFLNMPWQTLSCASKVISLSVVFQSETPILPSLLGLDRQNNGATQTANIFVELDGHTIARAIGEPLMDFKQ